MNGETMCRVVLWRAIVVPIIVFLSLPGIGSTQSSNDEDAIDFGDIFAHPRDRHYLPGAAPSRADLIESSDLVDNRGSVTRWEYKKGNRIIKRDVWTDENDESRGLLSIGRRF